MGTAGLLQLHSGRRRWVCQTETIELRVRRPACGVALEIGKGLDTGSEGLSIEWIVRLTMAKKWMVLPVVLLVVMVLGGVGAVPFWQYHERPQFCVTCHIMDPYLASWEASDFGAHEHEQADVVCLDCHEPTLQEQVHEVVVYVQGDYETPLPELKYPMEDCLECHEHGSYEQIIQMTADLKETYEANPHDSHFGQMECRLCHKMHTESEDYCAQCHSYGWQVP